MAYLGNGSHFQTSDALEATISKLTSDMAGKFRRRDFVEPLVGFCTDGCYNGHRSSTAISSLRRTGTAIRNTSA